MGPCVWTSSNLIMYAPSNFNTTQFYPIAITSTAIVATIIDYELKMIYSDKHAKACR